MDGSSMSHYAGDLTRYFTQIHPLVVQCNLGTQIQELRLTEITQHTLDHTSGTHVPKIQGLPHPQVCIFPTLLKSFLQIEFVKDCSTAESQNATAIKTVTTALCGKQWSHGVESCMFQQVL
jgi:hypothetical protein